MIFSRSNKHLLYFLASKFNPTYQNFFTFLPHSNPPKNIFWYFVDSSINKFLSVYYIQLQTTLATHPLPVLSFHCLMQRYTQKLI